MESMYVPNDVRKEFLAKKNVVGVGIGYKVSQGKQTDVPSVVAMVRRKESLFNLPPDDRIPAFAKGLIQTDVLEVGDIKALSYTNKERPAPGGVSIGHYRITAGTLGTVVRDANTGQVLILSNNHVLANSNEANLGDPILQPGPVDGGKLGRDEIGTLLRFVPIDFNLDGGSCPWAELYADFGNAVAQVFNSQHRVKTYTFNPQAVNYVDAAVATPYSGSDLDPHIVNIGVVNGIVPAFLGQEVRKTGRTTEYTEGKIELVDATVQVQYGAGKIATFEKQLISGYMSKGGDSGSLLVEKNSLRAVGLLYAGSDQVTIYNPIQFVLDALEITI
jgi:hypothetical protein